MNITPEEIEEKIRKAFACTAALDSIPADDYADLNASLGGYYVDGVKNYLPLLLIMDLNKGMHYSYLDTGDLLVYFLDGYFTYLKCDPNFKNDDLFESFVRDKDSIFSQFSHEQCEAVLLWLREFACPKYEDLCLDDLNSAIQYWQNRVDHHPEPNA